MIRTQVYIPDKLYNLAKLCAAQEGVSISEFMRQGLEIKIKNEIASQGRGAKKKGGLRDLCGKYTLPGGATDIASSHNDIYDL